MLARLQGRRLSVGLKLGLGFGSVAVLLVAVAAISLWTSSTLSSTEQRVSDSVVPRLLAADDVRAAGSDMHFSQTRYVLDHGATRSDFLADRGVYRKALERLKTLSVSAADKRSLARVLAADAQFQALDARLWADVRGGKAADANKLVHGAENDAADELTAATTAYQDQLRGERDRADRSFAAADSSGRTLILALGGAAVLLAIAIALLVSRGIRRGVGGVLHALRSLREQTVAELHGGLLSMAQGDLTRRLSTEAPRVERTSNDEIGDAVDETNAIVEATVASVEAYNESVEQLAGLVAGITESAGSLSAATQQMASTSDEAGRAVGEIATAVGDVAQGAERQVRMIDDARAAAERSNEAAADAERLARDGVAAMGEAAGAIEAMSEAETEVNRLVGNLENESGRINGIVETISAIAEQTNLLALNAAIEAARAGDQGRGFAVVADEVRKLAEEAQQAARSIAELIDVVQKDISDVAEIGAKRNALAGEARGRQDLATETFRRIEAAVAATRERAAEIVSATGEVASVAEQSSASTEEISASTEQTSASAQQIAASAQELASTAGRLETLVAQFRLA